MSQLHLRRNASFGQTEAGVPYQWGGTPTPDRDNTRAAPAEVYRTVRLDSVVTGRGFECGIRREDQAAICWGTASQRGQLGDGSTRWRAAPRPVLRR